MLDGLLTACYGEEKADAVLRRYCIPPSADGTQPGGEGGGGGGGGGGGAGGSAGGGSSTQPAAGGGGIGDGEAPVTTLVLFARIGCSAVGALLVRVHGSTELGRHLHE